MSSQIASAVPSLGMTLGAVYVGATVATMQLIWNFESPNGHLLQELSRRFVDISIFSRNNLPVSLVMALSRILDALHVALSTHAIYHYLIDSFGNYLGLDHIVCQEFQGYTPSDSGNVCALSSRHLKIKLNLLLVGGHFNQTLSWIVVLEFSRYTMHKTGIPSVRSLYSISNFLLIPSIKQRLTFHSTSDMLYGLM
ncbi:hypothetical protein ARMSODRAFT_981043 [Armillaria solidipes]|uniref:Uncharacterized protein n=1 Tax=Armillaria solidipes TaxID=1076256 RepID=A0A2H3BBU3_9AGAR|nr:hypothetical protein ARMSODRAFT_981043 [Armillaria solidipes]